jgi:hypothetical protein
MYLSETVNQYPPIRIVGKVSASRNCSKSIPMDSKVAYLDNVVPDFPPRVLHGVVDRVRPEYLLLLMYIIPKSLFSELYASIVLFSNWLDNGHYGIASILFSTWLHHTH